MLRRRFGATMSTAFIIQKLPDSLALPKQIKIFKRGILGPNFTDSFISVSENRPNCLQRERVVSKFLKTPLQPVYSLTSHPCETLQNNLVGPLKPPVHCYVLTAIDFFTKYLFAVLFLDVRANTIASELTSIIPNIVAWPNQFFPTGELPLFLSFRIN